MERRLGSSEDLLLTEDRVQVLAPKSVSSQVPITGSGGSDITDVSGWDHVHHHSDAHSKHLKIKSILKI